MRRLVVGLAACVVILGLLSVTPYSIPPLHSYEVAVKPAPSPDPFEEFERLDDLLEELRGLKEAPEYEDWMTFPIHPVTGRVMDPLFDCPGMPGPPAWE
ncbi:MAG: hypothetical protein ACYTGX_15455 [Planctomycetota bacterium]|jgi:hypothetical protein